VPDAAVVVDAADLVGVGGATLDEIVHKGAVACEAVLLQDAAVFSLIRIGSWKSCRVKALEWL
jgi:hypothetical protein